MSAGLFFFTLKPLWFFEIERCLFFEVFIWIGYVFGIIRKIMLWSAATEPLGWLFYLAWAFYVLNIVEITIDMALYFRNVKLDKAAGR